MWENDCTHCMACLHRCPAEAIEYKKHIIPLWEGVLFVMGCAGYYAPRMKIGSGFKLRRHLFSREGGLDIL
ncbi:4Fe-4S binding protein [Lacrimispora sp.]|uniref:4Fe-4S binding protein n=1 Tax=Lacrimispora sp. TaxID=2719234 RepID=UPI0032E3AB5F